ncbi:hypothetical protein SNE40_001474 [Patella caerulea]
MTIQLPDIRINGETNQGMVSNSNKAINTGGIVNDSLVNLKVIQSDGDTYQTSDTSSSTQIPNGAPAYPRVEIKDAEPTEMVSWLYNRGVANSGDTNNQIDSAFPDNETGNTLGNTLGAKTSLQEQSNSLSSDKDCFSTTSDVNVNSSDHLSRHNDHLPILYDKDATNKEPDTPPDKVTTYSVQNYTAKELTPYHIPKEGHDNLGYLPDSVNGKHVPGRHKKENGREEREPTPVEVIEDSNRYKKGSLTTETIKSTKETITHVEIDTEDSGPKIGITLKIVLSISNCLMITVTIGLLYALSVLLIGIIDEFQASRSQASPIFSVFTAILFGGGGVVGPLMNRFNGGVLCMIGAILASAGCVISFFAQSVQVLILSVGVMTGIGLTVPFLLPFTSAGGNMYGKHRLTMITVTSICPGVGGVIFPVMTSKLVDIYDWRGVILIYGGLLLNCFPVGYLNYIVKRRFCNTLVQKVNLKDIFNCSLFRKPLYLVLVFCVFLMNTLLPTVNVFFVDMVRGKGFDVETGSLLLSINGFSNIAGRILITFLTPFLKCARVGQWSLYLSIVSATVSVFVVASTYSELMVTTIVYGLFWGMAIVSYPTMLLELSGPKRYTNAIGYCNLIGGIGGLIGGPTAG